MYFFLKSFVIVSLPTLVENVCRMRYLIGNSSETEVRGTRKGRLWLSPLPPSPRGDRHFLREL